MQWLGFVMPVVGLMGVHAMHWFGVLEGLGLVGIVGASPALRCGVG